MLLPITSSFALPFSIYHLFLQVRVTFTRMALQKSLETSSKPSSGNNDDPLLAAFRSQGNFCENVPLALILAGAVELNAHAEFGLMVKGYGGIGRPIGFFGTAGVILGLAGYGAWLVREYWSL
ncbi:hypothetical protein LTS10_011130 [Elasticomyces elasticus]|nr:hypothetical protein LTS10_011130 [Elasticomyces elasticus]